MLIISRRRDDSIRIGADRLVTVLQVRGGAVTLRLAKRFGGRFRRVMSQDVTLRRGGSHAPGPDVRVTAVDVRGDRVRLGIDVPPGVSVHRREVYDQIKPGDGWPDDDADRG